MSVLGIGSSSISGVWSTSGGLGVFIPAIGCRCVYVIGALGSCRCKRALYDEGKCQ